MKLKLFGKTVIEIGSLPDPGPQPAPAPAPTPENQIPSRQTKFLSPRYEPSNITTNSDVLRIQDAIRTAEAGDTQQLFRFYRDILLSDDHISGEVASRKIATLSQPLAIIPEDKNNPDDVALALAMNQAKNDCENWDDGMKVLMGAHCLWPVAILERLYKPAEKKLTTQNSKLKTPQLNFTLRKFVPVNPQLICYQWAYMMGGVGLGTSSAIQLSQIAGLSRDRDGKATVLGADGKPANPYTIDLEAWEPYIKLWPIDQSGRIIYDVTNAAHLDPARHIVHRGHDLTEFRDNWGGPGRSLLMWWLLRGLGREWFARGMDRYGSPWPVGYTDAKDPEAVGLLQEAFALSRKIGGIVVDESSRIEIKEAMVQGMAGGFETFYNLCQDALSFRITGLKESRKPAGLNSGDSKMQSSVREDMRVHDQATLGRTCKIQIAQPFAKLNNLPGEVKFVWGGLSDDDANTFADLLVKMKQAGLQPTAESLPTINERTGLVWEIAPTPVGPVPSPGDSDPKSLSSLKSFESLQLLTAPQPGRDHNGAPNPVQKIIDTLTPDLAQAFRGAAAPIKTILLASTSREDFLKKLSAFYTDWSPDRIAQIADQALQLAAAHGAVHATEPSA